MASLKEVKGRILSVNNTLKITSAMKMVASAKLHKAQADIEGMLPYSQNLSIIMTHFLKAVEKVETPFSRQREVKRVALVIFSSNSSLCGAYNSNVTKLFRKWMETYKNLPKENIVVFAIGRKIADAVKKIGFNPVGDFWRLANKPNYADCAKLAEALCNRFLSGDLDRVDLIYHHFKSTASQVLINSTYLPLDMSEVAQVNNNKELLSYYFLEPTEQELLEKLIPEVLKLKIYTALLDSNASEHAARSMAMQIATDNAQELIQELTVLYNKGRQQAITNELLDIVGGTMA